MRDVGKPNGEIGFQSMVLKKLSSEPIQAVSVPISSVVKIDIEGGEIKVNDNYDFFSDLNNQLDPNTKAWRYSIDLDNLAAFGANFTKGLGAYVDSAVPEADKKRLHSFFKQLYKVFQVKNQTEKQHERSMY